MIIEEIRRISTFIIHYPFSIFHFGYPKTEQLRCNKLTSIVIPDGVISMGERVFQYCNTLRSVQLSGGLESVASYAFYDCNIEELTIPEGISRIESSAFGSDNELTMIRLPLTMETIGTDAFNSCGKLTDIYYPGTQAQAEEIQIGTGNAYLSSASWHFNAGPNLEGLELLQLPAMLRQIDAEALMGAACEAVIIPDGCRSIGARAFADCKKLVYIRIPSSVTSIAEDAFEGSDKVWIDRK